jgi:hypothetical protein
MPLTRLFIAFLLLLVSAAASAQERYALIVAGATGGEEYARQYSEWTASVTGALATRLAFKESHITLLSETDKPDGVATAANVRRVVTATGRRMTKDDLLFVLLIGHGTFDGADAKFNLVGPDLESAEWASLLDVVPGRVILVNSTAASFPFLERLAGPRRIVVTATDSAAQRFDTVFPGYFIAAFSDESADLDKNGRISIWEAFASASAAVRRHFQQRGQLSTERALLDDNGDGIGNEAAKPGDDGSQASRVYLDESRPGAAPTDEVLLKLLQRQAMLQGEADDLKIRRTFMPPAEYAAEFERLMIEIAKVSRDIRARTKT